MTEIRFYHLTRKNIEQVLPEMLKMTLQRGMRAVVMAGSDERVEALTQYLWTYNPNEFIPHGNAKDGYAADQPVWFTASDERPNDAAILFLADGAESAKLNEYQRVCEIFDGNDEASLTAARKRWAVYKDSGHELSYWQQGDKGWTDATPS